MRRSVRRGAALLLPLMLVVAACAGPAPAPAARGTAGFPRTAALYLAHEPLPPVAVLAAHDVVIIDNEWAHRSPEVFPALRARNPDIVLLAYVNVVDLPDRVGSAQEWANRYALWRFVDAGRNEFPAAWLARTADGRDVSEWPQTTMTNLTDAAPTVDDATFVEHAVDWMVDTVWAAGVWDGLFLDVWTDTVYTPTIADWDIDGDGTDETHSEIFGRVSPWQRGIAEAEAQLRQRLPDALLVANGDRSLADRHLNGRVWEHFSDPTRGREHGYDLQTYVEMTHQERPPGFALTIDRRIGTGPPDAEELRRARFFLTATMLQNGYWAPTGAGEAYGAVEHYDELDGGGLGRGYLGAPVVADPLWVDVQRPFADGVGSVAPQLYRRDFTHGIVLHNAGPTARTVLLEQDFRRLTGTQDPVTNDGATVREVTVPPQDGLVLLRPGPQNDQGGRR